MNKKDLYKLLEELCEKSSKEQIKKFLFCVIEKLSNSQNKEIIDLINEIFKDEIQSVNLKDLDKTIEKIEEQFDSINEGELQFHCETYETDDYDYYGDDYETRYYDFENVSSIILNAYNLAFILVTKKDYKNAKKILDLIVFTTYYVLEDDSNDILDYEINDIVSFELVNVDINKVCLTLLFITIFTGDNKFEEIYNYYKLHTFRNIKLEDSFSLGLEKIKNLDIFLQNWIQFLSQKNDHISFNLLINSLEYSNYDDYKKVLEMNKVTHPKLCIFILKKIYELKKYKEVIEIGESIINDVDDSIRRDIALLIAESYKKFDSDFDISQCLYIAFESSHSVSDLIRIINNEYLEKYREEIDLIKENPYKNLNSNAVVLFRYFLGEFDDFLNFFKNNQKYLGWTYSNTNTYVELSLFLLCDGNETEIKKKLASSICFDIGIRDDYNLYNADERGIEYFKILNVWKKHFIIADKIKQDYISWLEETIAKRVDAIVSNQHRGSYHKAAFLVCILDDCLENLNIKNKGEIIALYEKKYVRYTAFKKEIINIIDNAKVVCDKK